MKSALLLIFVLGVPTEASAQDVPAQSRDYISIGASATPALEGGGLWFMPGLRVTGRFSERVGLDIDASRVVGSSNAYSEITQLYQARLMFFRTPSKSVGIDRYWFVGPEYMRGTKRDGHGNAIRSESHTAGAVGLGLSQSFRNRSRVATEIGFSGGDGFMLFASVIVQYGTRR